MSWMETAAFISCTRFARKAVEILSVDDIHFFQSVVVSVVSGLTQKVGDRVLVTAQVDRTFKNVLDVGVKLEKLTLVSRSTTLFTLQNGEVLHALDAFMTFKTLNSDPVPELVPESEDERRCFEEVI